VERRKVFKQGRESNLWAERFTKKEQATRRGFETLSAQSLGSDEVKEGHEGSHGERGK